MTRPEQELPAQATERGAAFALLPIAASLLFYLSPPALQHDRIYQFMPQLCAYAALLAWIGLNKSCVPRLGLSIKLLPQGLRWGVLTGLLLGTINALVILYLVPALGGDYTFLTGTPHAQLPEWVMVPWFILFIATMVELNFRAFLIGRLLALKLSPSSAVYAAAWLFAFDPFLVATFQQLHWIAVWDGLIWGTLWVTFRNLYVTIVAHAVEVIVLYLVMRTVLG